VTHLYLKKTVEKGKKIEKTEQEGEGKSLPRKKRRKGLSTHHNHESVLRCRLRHAVAP
jgi:hypothetical protein